MLLIYFCFYLNYIECVQLNTGRITLSKLVDISLCYLLIDLLVKYHQSGRPYKLIAACLEEVHGLRRRYDINTLYYGCLIITISVRKIANSVAWLKKQFARLKLRRIGEYSQLPVVRNCVQVCVESKNPQICF